MFLLTTGDVLDDTQQAAFQRYIEAGGGFVGVHSASDTEHDWPWYGGLVGAYFKIHPAIQQAVLVVADPRDPSTSGLPARWTRTDEWYNFASNPRASVHVLLTLDETTYDPGDGAMGADHPIAWSHDFDGGRAWYTGLGHTIDSYSEPLFLSHLLGGIMDAAKPAASPPPSPPKIVLLTTAVKSRKLTMTVTTGNCATCAVRARIALATRSVTAPLRLASGRWHGMSTRLPKGKWQLTITVSDAATGLSATVRRSVRVR